MKRSIQKVRFVVNAWGLPILITCLALLALAGSLAQGRAEAQAVGKSRQQPGKQSQPHTTPQTEFLNVTTTVTSTILYFPIFFKSLPPPPPPPPPPTSPYDMAQFLTGDGRLYEVQHSTGPQARHQTQFESGRFFHTKGNESHAEWEELWATNKHIMRGTDTSPGNGHYYTLRDGGKYGSKWAPRIWEVGELFERNPQVTFYRKDNCSIVANGSQRSWLKFEAFHASFTFPGGIKLYNVVELQWLLEKKAEPTETYFYAEGYGLVGWRSNDRGFSYVSEIHEPGARPDNTMEQISCINPNNFPTPADPSIPFGPLPPPFRAK